MTAEDQPFLLWLSLARWLDHLNRYLLGLIVFSMPVQVKVGPTSRAPPAAAGTRPSSKCSFQAYHMDVMYRTPPFSILVFYLHHAVHKTKLNFGIVSE